MKNAALEQDHRQHTRGVPFTMHPNGFAVRLLATLPWGMRLRIHVWPEGVERLETPHDHRSWFVSLPLWGTFLEQRFEESDAGDDRAESYQVLRCHKTSGNRKPITTPEGTASLRLLHARLRYRLRPYFCPSHAIHSFSPTGSDYAASLVLFGPPKQVPRAYVGPP